MAFPAAAEVFPAAVPAEVFKGEIMIDFLKNILLPILTVVAVILTVIAWIFLKGAAKTILMIIAAVFIVAAYIIAVILGKKN